MAARNADSMNEKQGEFKPRQPRDEPMTTKGHQLGQLVSEKDKAEEFTAKTLPPGSAPKDRTFQPNNLSEVPSQANNPDVLPDDDKEPTYTSASDTLGGATSKDVNKGLGRPMQGETSTEIRHDGQHHRKREGAGLEGVGSSGDHGIEDPKYNPDPNDDHPEGPIPGREHNAVLAGGEDMFPEKAGEFSKSDKEEKVR
ncbi:hypothetical protein GJ744_005563 [Endocarpon pusillum]|uniref:Uncharacterized protein n=1 Tax=Endocarpon pusillum TaxID=364733 RepID=A0A8H7E6E0_9EURO|nr:hypothetical protein GJ744_005563 [Endocarpon pusillum]